MAVVLATVAAFTTAYAGQAQEDPPAKAKVLVKDNFFQDRSTHVDEGGRVTWTWRGMNRHNIAFTKVPPGASRKGAKTRTEGHWKRTFGKPGVYRYVCRLWSGMRGTVTVRPKPKPEG